MPAPGTCTINDLPDEVLVQVLGRLSVKERYGGAALACRRWRTLSLAPQLVEKMQIQLRGVRVLPQLQSLRTFMRHAGPHVRELKLDVEADNAPEGYLTALQPMVGGVLHQLGDQLTRLDMELWHGLEDYEVVLNDWLLNSLHSLRSLSIHCAGLVMSGGLALLTALQELRLHQYSGPKILESAVLPQSLTKLVIFEPVGALPQQISTLTRLDTLELLMYGILSDSFGALEPLAPTLRRLVLDSNLSCLPTTTLSALTGLRSLVIASIVGDRNEERLASALQHLSQLTKLRVLSSSGPPPQTLTALTQLRALSWTPLTSLPDHRPVVGELSLPLGQWLAGLHTLAIHEDIVDHSIAALKAATSLQLLAVGVGSNLVDKYDRVLYWALQRHWRRQHVPRLLFSTQDKHVRASTIGAIFWARDQGLDVSYQSIYATGTLRKLLTFDAWR